MQTKPSFSCLPLNSILALLVSLPLFLFSAQAAVVNATWNSANDVPVTAASYTATGNTVNFTLNHAPATGANLTVVNNTGLPFIQGVFGNLTQGQTVSLVFGGMTYDFVANYYGGTGNDLVLQWAYSRVAAWGYNAYGQLGDNSTATDGDGLNDVAEFQMEALGFDWQVSQPALVDVYFANAEAGGLGSGHGLHVDAPKLTKDPGTGLFKLQIGIQKSTDLLNFTPFPMTAPQTPISGDGKLEFEFASPDNAAFYRLLAE